MSWETAIQYNIEIIELAYGSSSYLSSYMVYLFLFSKFEWWYSKIKDGKTSNKVSSNPITQEGRVKNQNP